jgi:hypothetical protein
MHTTHLLYTVLSIQIILLFTMTEEEEGESIVVRSGVVSAVCIHLHQQ